MESIPIISAVTSVLGLFGGGKGGEQQPAQAPAAAAPPASQAAKTPTVQAFERQNQQQEGPMAGSPGSTLLTADGLGAGALGKSKTLGA